MFNWSVFEWSVVTNPTFNVDQIIWTDIPKVRSMFQEKDSFCQVSKSVLLHRMICACVAIIS
jgi:hypothetical protein